MLLKNCPYYLNSNLFSNPPNIDRPFHRCQCLLLYLLHFGQKALDESIFAFPNWQNPIFHLILDFLPSHFLLLLLAFSSHPQKRIFFPFSQFMRIKPSGLFYYRRLTPSYPKNQE